MVTIKALCDDLAAALGMSPHDVANVGDELSRADMISQSDARATVEDAAMLLIGVTADYLCRDRASVVKKFWDIPLIEISNLPEAPNTDIWNINLADDPYAVKYLEFYGDTLGATLSNMIGDEIWLPDSKSEYGHIVFEWSQGNTGASIRHDLSPRTIYLLFGHHIDGADELHGPPPEWPIRIVENPPAILKVLSDALDGASHPWVDVWAAEKFHQAPKSDQKDWRN